MRIDSNIFDTSNAELAKKPRYIVGIDFDGSITYITSHDGIASVPGSPIENALSNISATSQTLNPDKANATVGTMSFSIIDKNNAFTDLVRTKLDSDIGLKGRTVTFLYGFEGLDFTDFVLFQTQIVRSVKTKGGFYDVSCADIQRETKTRIFELALTFLVNSISDSATTISVLDLSGFEGNNHGTSYSDAPSANVIYVRIDQTKEIIRCPVSGISGNDFTGVTRGALGTKAKAVEVDPTLPSDRRPQVKEYVYIELPAVKLAYAILTGDIEGTADVLPSGWHAGVDTAFVRLSDFTSIGADLWDTTDDTEGLVVRFEGLDSQDAKRFLETELYLLLGVFSPVYADGQLGLKRMVPSLVDSPYVTELNNDNVTGHSSMMHDMESVLNNIRIDWNWNGTRFIRSTIFIDSTSIARHGIAPQKRIGFKGLVGTRFTEGLLGQMITSLRDMYTGPPLKLQVSGFHSLNQLEIGDAVRVALTGIRDFSNTPANLQRTMVIHGMTVNWMQGVKLKLFGSSDRLTETAPTADTSVLPGAFYASEGTDISTIPGLLTGDVTNAGTFTLTGGSDMNAAASIFYHDGPLTISSSTTLIIENNVQLRVGGFLTINGTIDGIENGHGGGTDTSTIDADWNGSGANTGTKGFIGNCWSHGGIQMQPDHSNIVSNLTGYLILSDFDAFPNIITQVDASGSGSISGIPTDMRGAGAAAGGRVVQRVLDVFRIKAKGGGGGAGGAGFTIVSKGGDFGASGAIDLSGGDGLENDTSFVLQGHNFFAGTGGGGAPGALLWLLDGAAVTFPDLLGKFSAVTGEVQVDFPIALPIFLTDIPFPVNVEGSIQPERRISLFDQSGTNFRIQYLAADDTPIDDQGELVPPPTALAAVGVLEGVLFTWVNPPDGQFSTVEVWISDDNDIANAIHVGDTVSERFLDYLDYRAKRVRYGWVRARDADGNVSVYEPDLTTTTATDEPLRERKNWVLDPEFDIGDPDPNWLGNGNGSQTEFWRANITGSGTADHVPGGGQSGSVAIDLLQDGTTARTEIQHKKRVSFKGKNGTFLFQIKYRTEGSIDALDHDNFAVTIEVSELEFGGSVTGFVQSPLVTLPRSATFVTYETVWSFNTSSNINWVSFAVGLRNDQGTADKLRIDSIQVQSLGTEFGKISASGQTKPGLVPLALSGEQTKFLKGDGTWADAGGGGGVDSFEGRSGDVVATAGDYADITETFIALQTFDAGIRLLDDDTIVFGASADVTMRWDSTPGELSFVGLASNQIVNWLDGMVLRIWNSGDTDYISLGHDGTDAVIDGLNSRWLTFGADFARILANAGVFSMVERAAALSPVASVGDVWTKNTAPNTLWFTNDAGVDFQLGVGGDVDSVFGRTGAVVGVAGDYAGVTETFVAVQTFDAGIKLLDGDTIAFGTGSDITMRWDGVDFEIVAALAGRVINWRDGLNLRMWNSGDTDYISLGHDGTDAIIDGLNSRWLTLGADFARVLANGGVFSMVERAAAISSVASVGDLWVKNTAPNNLMFTRDDGEDVDLAGVIKTKTADKLIDTSTTLEDDNHLLGWSLEADTRYAVEGFLNYKQNGGDIKWRFQFTNASQAAGSGITFSCVDQNGNTQAVTFSNFDQIFSITTMSDNFDVGCHVSGILRSNATTGGTMDFQWAQNTSHANATTMRNGSWIRLTRL